MFEGFSEETSQFLWELAFHNEKPWFDEHKQEFVRVLKDPFQHLAEDTRAALEELTGQEWDMHVSRIYRDARRLYGRGPYKDHLWFTLRPRAWAGEASFWFELGAASYAYGCGVWARPAQMEAWRRYVDADPAAVERLAKRLRRDKRFTLMSEQYARPKGDRGALLNPWYNCKELDVGCRHDFGEELFDTELPRRLAEDYRFLLPYGELFRHCSVE